jgi:hypothetical protein
MRCSERFDRGSLTSSVPEGGSTWRRVAAHGIAAMARTFISYRRQDSPGHAGRLYDSLSRHFGENQLVMDLKLEPGMDFVDRVDGVVGSCPALIAIIGPEWARSTDPRGERRLEHPDDFVRLEIEAALADPDVRLVPALVNGASMPARRHLPHSLAGLVGARAIELSDARWEHDVARLITTLDEVFASASARKA